MDQDQSELQNKAQLQPSEEDENEKTPPPPHPHPHPPSSIQTLQDLVAGNALIDAFMGITKEEKELEKDGNNQQGEAERRQVDPSLEEKTIRAAEVEEEEEEEQAAQFLLSSIESCHDIEQLVQDLQEDLEEWNRRNDDSLKHHMKDMTANDTGVIMENQIFVAARLARIKSLLYNERNVSSSSSGVSTYNPLFFLNLTPQSQRQRQQQHKTHASALVHSLLLDSKRKEIIIYLLEYLNDLPFEARKDVASIFNYLLVCGCVIDGQEEGERTFGNGAFYDRWVISSTSSGSTSNDEVTLSYVQTMLSFVEYVHEYYVPIMTHIVEGHYVAGTNAVSGTTTTTTTATTEDGTTGTCIIKSVDVALHCGTMLRSTLRHVKLYANLVQSCHTPRFVYPFLNAFVNQPNFEVASDALETLRLILHPNINAIAVPSFGITTSNSSSSSSNATESSCSLDIVQVRESLESMMESTAAIFLEREYEAIFVQRFNVLLLSAEHANYITRRVSLQILSTVLLTRSNYNVMIRYVSSRSNLKTIMMLLSDSSAHITLEAFHVFKIFVANPNKPKAIVRILVDNKVKLVKYLTGLHRDKEAMDEQFRDEKALVISTLEEIEYHPPPSATDGS
jgi:Mo25-like.